MSEQPSSPAPAADDDFQQAMRRFQQEFAAQLPGRLQEARDRLRACQAQPADDAAVAELHRVLHKIAGSAGTFGLAEVGDGARALEDMLEPMMTRPGRTAADFDPVERLLEDLLRSVPAQ
jgi:chemotaxis protein histidine kinase CheA